MKNIKYLIGFFLALTIFVSCEEENYEFGDIVAPSNVEITAQIVGQDGDNLNGDGSGLVDFEVTAENEITYHFDYGDGFNEVVPTGKVTHRFTTVGVNIYTVVVSAIGTGGIKTSTSIDVDVLSTFDNPEVKDFLSGGAGNNKTWYWAADKPGNIGLGPNEVMEDGSHTWPAWFSSDAWHADKLCMYDAEFVFTQSVDGDLSFEQTENIAYVPGTYAGNLGVDGDTCHGDDVIPSLLGVKQVALAPSSSIATETGGYMGTTLNFLEGGFMCWYVGSSNFEIIEITDNTLYVRVTEPGYAWYCKFQTQNPYEVNNFPDLVWSDEFDTDGAPNAANWTYDLGAGGWGNGEEQTYTDAAANVVVENGSLVIKAIAENGGYTSARLKSQGLYDFTFGKVEVRAKLPEAQGTWPAIWLLGSSFESIGWPHCGEVDIMEQTGQNKDEVLGTCHWYDTANSSNASAGDSSPITDASTEFHIYSIEWTEDAIKIFVDNTKYFELANNADLPFDENFFLILNIAMGGTLGGTIDPNFTEDTMEIDYVRVYQ